MKNVRFKKPVIPGDQLVMEVELLNRKMNILMFKGVAYVDGVPVAEAEFQASIVDR